MILKIVNVDITFARTCERLNTFANVYERSQKINVNDQNSTTNSTKHCNFLFYFYYLLKIKYMYFCSDSVLFSGRIEVTLLQNSVYENI